MRLGVGIIAQEHMLVDEIEDIDPQALLRELSRWKDVSHTDNPNHWILPERDFVEGNPDDIKCSIRATSDEFDIQYHLSPRGGWVVEIFPIENFPVSPREFEDPDSFRQFFPDDAENARETVLAIMLLTSISNL